MMRQPAVLVPATISVGGPPLRGAGRIEIL